MGVRALGHRRRRRGASRRPSASWRPPTASSTSGRSRASSTSRRTAWASTRRSLADAATGRTRAILPVHVFGRPCRIEAIAALARERAAGASSRTPARASARRSTVGRSGSFGDVAVFAFYPNKQITTGEGGMVVTDDPGPRRRHAQPAQPGPRRGRHLAATRPPRLQLPARRDVGRARRRPARAARASCGQDGARVAAAYEQALGGPRLGATAATPGRARTVDWFVYVIRLDPTIDREPAHRPAGRGWASRRVRTSPRSTSSRSTARPFGFRPGDFPVTERVAASTLALPFSSRLADDDVAYVADVLRRGRRCPTPEADRPSGPAARSGSSTTTPTRRIDPNGTRHFDLARQLVARGRSVTIFAAGFSHVTGREERLAAAPAVPRPECSTASGSSGSGPSRIAATRWRRQVNMLSFVARLPGRPDPRCRDPTAIVGSTVHPFAALGGWIDRPPARRARSSSRSATSGRRPWSTSARCASARPASGCCGPIEAFLVRRASVVITLLPGMADYLHGASACRRTTSSTSRTVSTSSAFDGAVAAGGRAQPAAERSLATIDRMRGDGPVRARLRGILRSGQPGRHRRRRLPDRRGPPARVGSGLVLVGDGPERADVERWRPRTGTVAVFGRRCPSASSRPSCERST